MIVISQVLLISPFWVKKLTSDITKGMFKQYDAFETIFDMLYYLYYDFKHVITVTSDHEYHCKSQTGNVNLL